MKKTLAASAVLTVAGLLAAACGSSTSNSSGSSSASAKPSGGSSSASTAGKFLGCMVTDTGGIDDRSFNASSWQGMQEAASANPSKISVTYLQSTTQSDYTPNINTFISKKCGIVVTVGFLMAQATQTASKANPSDKFAIVDNAYTPAISNVDALLFNTVQDGFQGGYLAAGMSKTGKVATFGGQKLPTVTIYMDGFYDGVQYYNRSTGRTCRCWAGTRAPRTAASPVTSPTRQRAERDPDVHHRRCGRHLPGGRQRRPGRGQGSAERGRLGGQPEGQHGVGGHRRLHQRRRSTASTSSPG